MNFINKLTMSNKGFASFEFVWTIPIFAILFVIFSDFFYLFNSSARTMIDLHNSAFSTMGQVNRKVVGNENKNTGLTYRGEYLILGKCKGPVGPKGCNSTGERFVLSGRSKKYIFFGGHTWYPSMEFHLKLSPP